MKKVEYPTYIVFEDGGIFCKKRNLLLYGTEDSCYLKVRLYIGGERKRFSVHRVVAKAFHKNPCNLPQVNHKNGNKLDNKASNLEWCDARHNNIHAIQTGLRNVAKSNKSRWEDRGFREATSKKISETRKERSVAKGRNNPRFKYEIVTNQWGVLTLGDYFPLQKRVGSLNLLTRYVKEFLECGKWVELFSSLNATPRYA